MPPRYKSTIIHNLKISARRTYCQDMLLFHQRHSGLRASLNKNMFLPFKNIENKLITIILLQVNSIRWLSHRWTTPIKFLCRGKIPISNKDLNQMSKPKRLVTSKVFSKQWISKTTISSQSARRLSNFLRHLRKFWWINLSTKSLLQFRLSQISLLW